MDIQYSCSDGDLLDFILENFDNDEDQTNSTSTSRDSNTDNIIATNNDKNSGSHIIAVKASNKKTGSKVSLIPNCTTIQTRKKILAVEQILTEGRMVSNTSRRSPDVLLVFPSFDKCDSLLYFASSLTRHMNSADLSSVVRLMTRHNHKDCSIEFSMGKDFKISTHTMIKMLYLFDEIEPDKIMCVHSTKVIENKIISTIYAKLTDCQRLYTYKSKEINDLPLKSLCIENRADRFSLLTQGDSSTDTAREQIQALSHTNDDVLMYLSGEMVLTVDDLSKKITRIHFSHKLTSVHPVQRKTEDTDK